MKQKAIDAAGDEARSRPAKNENVAAEYARSLMTKKQKLTHYWRRLTAADYGRVNLEDVLDWTRASQIIIQGRNVEKKHIIFNRILDKDGMNWKRGGFAFVGMERAMQIEDALERQGIEVNIFMMRDLLSSGFDFESIRLLPAGVVTVFAYDGTDSEETKKEAIDRVRVFLSEQFWMYFDRNDPSICNEKLLTPEPVEVRRKRIVPLVFEGLLTSYSGVGLFGAQMRSFFTTVHFVDQSFAAGTNSIFEADDQAVVEEARYLVANTHMVLLLKDDEFKGVYDRGRSIHNSPVFAESSLEFPSKPCYDESDPYNAVLTTAGVYLSVDLKRKAKS
jgi:hypothetical protein